MYSINVPKVKEYFLSLQNALCDAFQCEDKTAVLIDDSWHRIPEGRVSEDRVPEGRVSEVGNVIQGSGRSLVFKNGSVLEQAGINFSHVYGETLPHSAMHHLNRDYLKSHPFEALGVSVVVHPKNPFVPTAHMNVRLFRVIPNDNSPNHNSNAEKRPSALANKPLWWFGGGFDLTPYYPFKEDCIYWHTMAKKACAVLGHQAYPKYKQWCDDYFYLKHRQESRGIGGIFFDDLNQDQNWEKCFEFVQSVGNHFLEAYQTVLSKRKNLPYSEKERLFQLYRRGRYVEFNLVQDRGTLFGLQTGGRVESILMSLPPAVHWDYNWQPEPGSKEAELYQEYLKPIDWASLSL